MPVSEPFRRRIKELVATRFDTVAEFHRALTAAGLKVDPETARLWVVGKRAPRRSHLEVIDRVLDAGGELLDLAGYASGTTLPDRVTALEKRSVRIERLLRRLLDGEAPR